MAKRAKVPEGRVIFSVEDAARRNAATDGKDLFFGQSDPAVPGPAAGELASSSPSAVGALAGQQPVSPGRPNPNTVPATISLVNSHLGAYVLQEELGRGPMGTVYRARHTSSGEFVAVKVLHPWLTTLPGFVDALVSSLRSIAALHHLNIAAIHEVGQVDQRIYLVGDLSEGRPLDRFARAEGLPDPERAVRIAIQIAVALDYAHANAVAHGAVKPSNVILGVEDRVTLLDFGITRLADEALRASGAGGMLAKLEYVAPEQFGGREGGRAADRYAFAVLFFELLAGVPPFRADGQAGIIAGHIGKTPPSLHALRPDLSPAVDHVFARALAKDPESRYPTCTAVVHAVALAMRSAMSPAEPVSEEPPRSLQKRRLPVATLAVVGALLALAATAWFARGALFGLPQATEPIPTPNPASPTTIVTQAPLVAPTTPVIVTPSPTAVPAQTPTSVPPTPAPTAVPAAVPAGPGGTLLVVRYVADGINTIFGLNIANRKLEPLPLPGGSNWAPAVSVDGQWLAFSTGSPAKGDIAVARRDGTEARVVARAGALGLASPAWLPGGRLGLGGAVGDKGEIYDLAVSGDNPVQLTAAAGVIAEVRIPTWSRQDKVFAYSGKQAGLYRVFVQAPDGTTRAVSPEAANAYTPAWSPDGKRIAFSGQLANGTTGIFTVNPDGSDLAQVVAPPTGAWACCAAWSPDSRYLAYVGELGSGPSPNHGNLYVVSAQGGQPERVLGDNLTYYWRPAWLP
ncbi:MAG: protein kinase domain-containing protein [Chloroflexota bacterium]